MSMAARAVSHLVLFLVLSVTGAWLWQQHAHAWDLGRRSPILSYDAAQYMVAARELAQHGRFATTYALPLELGKHSQPPWPLALVQPGLVIGEAMLYRTTPAPVRTVGGRRFESRRPDQLESLALVIPCSSYLLIAIALALATSHLMRLSFPAVSTPSRTLAGGLVALAFLLDPESQHYAVGGFTELPFTLGLVCAIGMLALGIAARWPLLFGLVLGVTGSFRGTMLWLAPAIAMGTACSVERGHRVRLFARVMIGYAIPLIPWWLYKWHAFGTPAWDLSALSVWDGVQGRTWFTIFHQTDAPELPQGLEALSLLAQKTLRNLPQVAGLLARGLLPLFAGAQLLWFATAREAPRAMRAAVVTVFVLLAISAFTAALSVPQLRYLYPARMPFEAAGILTLIQLADKAPSASRRARVLLVAACAVLVLGWGAWQTWRGGLEAAEASQERGTPGTLTLLQIASLMSREIPAGEPVMSNLGPTLAWEARRPVIALSSSPDDLNACRRRMDFHHVLLVFREADRAWP
ncbi:MAG: hypothetical protein ACRENS_04220, partial [Candidatus Eiseniibacteriota bacterium]